MTRAFPAAAALALGAALALAAAPSLAAPSLPSLPDGPYDLVGMAEGASFYVKVDSARPVDDGVDFTLLVVASPPGDNGSGPGISFAVMTEHISCRGKTYFSRRADMFDIDGGLIGSVEHPSVVSPVAPNSPVGRTSAILCDGGPSHPVAAGPAEALAQTQARAGKAQ